MLKAVVVALVALAVGIGFARTMSFGDKPPSRAPVQLTPSATARAPAAAPSPIPRSDQDAVTVTVSADRISVRPRSVRRGGRLVHARFDNQAGYMIEVLLARGAAPRLLASPAALERAQIAPAVPMGSGEQRRDALRLAAGRYTVLARPLTEGDAPPSDPIGYATIRVR